MTINKEKIKEKIRKDLIKARGDRSIRQVAKEIGVSHSTLSRFENKVKTAGNGDTLMKIMVWLSDQQPLSLLARLKLPSSALKYLKFILYSMWRKNK